MLFVFANIPPIRFGVCLLEKGNAAGWISDLHTDRSWDGWHGRSQPRARHREAESPDTENAEPDGGPDTESARP